MRGPHTFGPKYTFVLLSFPESCLSPRSLFSQGSAYLNSRICGTWLAGQERITRVQELVSDRFNARRRVSVLKLLLCVDVALVARHVTALTRLKPTSPGG